MHQGPWVCMPGQVRIAPCPLAICVPGPADVISALSYNQAFSLAYDSLTWLTPFLPRIQADIEIGL